MNACAFTGHRPTRFKFGYDEQSPLCKSIKKSILDQCRKLYETEHVRTFYTGCALGVDIWGAEAVLLLRSEYPDIKLICAMPFPKHTAKWSDEQKQRFDKILSAADEQITVCERYSDDAYKQRNYYMVDNAQFIIAVFDDVKGQRSGTLQTVNYARRKNRQITPIHPDTASIIP